MGQHLAKLCLLTMPAMPALGGCSLIYNPSDLPNAVDAMPDAPPDIFPCLLELTDVTPSVIYEGMGTGGSRSALIVLHGKNLVNASTSVMVNPPMGTARVPMLTLDGAKLQTDILGELLAVPITLSVDATLPSTETVPLDITVAQDCPEGRVQKVLSGKLSLKGLDELVDGTAMIALDAGIHEYSQINVATSTIVPGTVSGPLILRSMSSVNIAKPIVVSAPAPSASASPGGPAGGQGGAGGTGLGGAGTPGAGPSAGQPSGGPGRFDSPDFGLSTLNNPNRSSGGAGGDGAVVGGKGGRGGGGGGSIEITAAGDLKIDIVAARGATGQGGSFGGASGGGGSGGVVLVRAGGTLTTGDLDVSGGGNGHPGRARYDAAGTVTGPLGPEHYRGPMFLDPPQLTREGMPALMVVGKPLSQFRYFFLNNTGDQVKGPFNGTIAGNGMARVTPPEQLYRGLNQVCVVVEGGSTTSDTRNCVDIAYLK